MIKYKGKYSKCRKCIHVKKIHMMMVSVKSSCLKGKMFLSGLMVNKPTCEKCQQFEIIKEESK